MAKITIADVSGGYNLQQDVNARFQQVEDALNTNVLWRTAVMGESNNMDHDIDMDNNDVMNVMNMEATNIVSGGIDIIAQVEAAELAATQQASSAADSAIAAAASAVTANNGIATIGVSEAAAAQSAIDSEASNQSAINAYNQSIIQVGLAEDEVAKCVVQVGLAADEVQLANDQVQLAGAQTTLCQTAAGTASADAIIAANGAFQVNAAETRINNAIAVLDMTGIIGPGDDDAVSNANLQIELDNLDTGPGGDTNLFMNGSFQVNEDGIKKQLANSPSTVRASSRWYVESGGSSGRATFSITGSSNVLNLLSGRKNTVQTELAITNSMDTVNGYAMLYQRIPNVEDICLPRSDMGTRNLVVSFKGNSPYNLPVKVRVTMNYGVGGGAPTVHDTTVTALTSTWEEHQAVVELPNLQVTTVKEGNFMQVELWFGGGSALGSGFSALGTSNRELYIGDMKCEISDEVAPVATAFIQPELRETEERCKYYFERLGGDATVSVVVGAGLGYSSSYPQCRADMRYAPKRVAPTTTINGVAESITGSSVFGEVHDVIITDVNLVNKQGRGYVSFGSAIETLPQTDAYILRTKVGTENYIDIDAEL